MIRGIWEFLELIEMIFSWLGFVIGMFVGMVLIVAVSGAFPYIYRAKRRRDLRRMWRRNQPRPLMEGMVPVWREYDPEDATVDHRCVCHGRVLYPGERALYWPEVGPLGVLHTSVYCESVREVV
jgi:hypothetical protein